MNGGSAEGTQRPQQQSEGGNFRMKVLNGTMANFHTNSGSSSNGSSGLNTSAILNKRIVIL